MNRKLFIVNFFLWGVLCFWNEDLVQLQMVTSCSEFEVERKPQPLFERLLHLISVNDSQLIDSARVYVWAASGDLKFSALN